VPWTTTSDQRFKTNIQANIPGLSFIDQLRPVTYQLDVNHIWERQGSGMPEELETASIEQELRTYSGFIAQEVDELTRRIGYVFNGIDRPQNERDAFGLSYASFVPALVKAMQELDIKKRRQGKQIDLLDAQIDQQEERLEALLKRIEALESTSNQ
ncbi:MAG: tail fiber domain-containing protein, partial [Bacteroidota bacterium]